MLRSYPELAGPGDERELIKDRLEIIAFFTKDKTVGNETQKGFLDHFRRFLLVMSTYFGCLHGELPALDLQEGDTTFLEEIVFKATVFFRQVILIVPYVRGHRDSISFKKILDEVRGLNDQRTDYKDKRQNG